MSKENNANKKEEKKLELTDRQKALYELIHHNSFVEHRKTGQKEIYEKLKNYGYQWSESNNTSDHCSPIWSDIKAINLSMENDHVIITEKYIYWIGSKEESEKFLQKLWKDVSGRLKRYWFYTKKLDRDGQMDIFRDEFLNMFNQ